MYSIGMEAIPHTKVRGLFSKPESDTKTPQNSKRTKFFNLLLFFLLCHILDSFLTLCPLPNHTVYLVSKVSHSTFGVLMVNYLTQLTFLSGLGVIMYYLSLGATEHPLHHQFPSVPWYRLRLVTLSFIYLLITQMSVKIKTTLLILDASFRIILLLWCCGRLRSDTTLFFISHFYIISYVYKFKILSFFIFLLLTWWRALPLTM